MKALNLIVVLTLLFIQSGQAQQEMTPSEAIAAIKRLDQDLSPNEKRVSLPFHKNLTGDTLVPLRSLPQLQELFLSWSNVDDTSLSHVRGLKQLHTLGLDGTKVSDAGLVNLKELSALKSLSFEQAKIGSKALEHLRNLSKLEYLNLERTKVDDEGLAHLAKLVKLNELNLTMTKITGAGLVHLKNMVELEYLELCYTAVDSEGLQHLKGMKRLKNLKLFNSNIDDRGLVHLSGLADLDDLSLHCTDISDAGLAHLKDLKQLSSLTLNGTKISDVGLVHLKGLTHLKVLFLNDQVSHAGMMKLKAALPNCEMGRYDEETNKVAANAGPKKPNKTAPAKSKAKDRKQAKPNGDSKPDSLLHAPRVWTDVTGNFKLEARFIRKDGGYVVFQRADNGREFRLTMGTLSKEDQSFLERELGMTSKPKNSSAPKKLETSILKRTRTWTDSTGRFKIKANFIERDGNTVVLQKADNQEKIRIDLTRLSRADQAFINANIEKGKNEMMPRQSKEAQKSKTSRSKTLSNRRNSKATLKARANGVLAISGFNSKKGLAITGRIRAVYPLNVPNRPGGAKEFGWSNPWPASPKAVFQSDTVYEGDGALHLVGTVNYGRRFAGPITGVVEIEQYVRTPIGGNLTCYVWETNSTNCGAMWRLENGKFKVLHGDERGSGKWNDTGITAAPDEWTKVILEIDETKKRWKLKLPEKKYDSPELKYRGSPKHLLMINYLTETQPGAYIDGLQIRLAKQQ